MKFAAIRQASFYLDYAIWQAIVTFVVSLTVVGARATRTAGFFYSAMGPWMWSFQWRMGNATEALGIAALFAPFFLAKDALWGYSPGKLLFGLKVVDETTGRPIGFMASFKRNLLLVIPFISLIVGARLMAGKRAGDGWGNSRVIWKKYAKDPVFQPADADRALAEE